MQSFPVSRFPQPLQHSQLWIWWWPVFRPAAVRVFSRQARHGISHCRAVWGEELSDTGGWSQCTLGVLYQTFCWQDLREGTRCRKERDNRGLKPLKQQGYTHIILRNLESLICWFWMQDIVIYFMFCVKDLTDSWQTESNFLRVLRGRHWSRFRELEFGPWIFNTKALFNRPQLKTKLTRYKTMYFRLRRYYD